MHPMLVTTEELDAMLDRVRTTMPLDKPSTLSRQQIADVLAYLGL